jgi:hypothetical protein
MHSFNAPVSFNTCGTVEPLNNTALNELFNGIPLIKYWKTQLLRYSIILSSYNGDIICALKLQLLYKITTAACTA